MNRAVWYLLRRVGFAMVAVWAVVTIVFLFVSLTPDPYLAELLHYKARHTRGNATAAVQQLRESYVASRGLGRPLWIRYTDWLVHVLTLDWGLSWSAEVPVYTLVKQYTVRSATYVIPSVLVSSVGGAVVGFYSAANRYTLPDRVSTILAYVGVGIPNFWLAAMAIIFIQGEEIGYLRTYIRVPELDLSAYLLPAIVLSVVLLGNQIHYARAEVHEILNENFVDVLRAKGVSKYRVARHVLRNAVLPLVSLFFADLLAVLMLHVFVIETIFGIPGIGRLTLIAVDTRDLPLIMGVTMVVVFVGIVGNLLQDLVAFVLDPRVRLGEA